MKYSKTLSVNKKLISVALSTVFLISACGEEATGTSGEGFNSDKDTNTGFDQGKLIACLLYTSPSPRD